MKSISDLKCGMRYGGKIVVAKSPSIKTIVPCHATNSFYQAV